MANYNFSNSITDSFQNPPDEELRDLVLVVDDNMMNRMMLSEILEDEYDVIEAGDGVEALEQIEAHLDNISAVMLDIFMPRLDGFGVLEELRKRGLGEVLPVLIVTGDNSREVEERCFNYTVSDFVRKPYDEKIIDLRLRNAVFRRHHSSGLQRIISGQERELQEKNRRLEEMNMRITEMLGSVVEARDSDSGQHIFRVREFTRRMADTMSKVYPEYGLDERRIQLITSASPLHDVGKIMVPDAILLKPGKLTDEEFDLMKKHTVYGCEILDRNRDNWDEEYYTCAREICRFHHEKFDGRGYPDGLKGDEIPVSAQIVAIADCFDALTQDRVYKKAFAPDTAYDMIMTGKCGQFSPRLLDVFTRCLSDMKAMVKN